jgi:hypothetical protein
VDEDVTAVVLRARTLTVRSVFSGAAQKRATVN